jgi:hypothetical protein
MLCALLDCLHGCIDCWSATRFARGRRRPDIDRRKAPNRDPGSIKARSSSNIRHIYTLMALFGQYIGRPVRGNVAGPRGASSTALIQYPYYHSVDHVSPRVPLFFFFFFFSSFRHSNLVHQLYTQRTHDLRPWKRCVGGKRRGRMCHGLWILRWKGLSYFLMNYIWTRFWCQLTDIDSFCWNIFVNLILLHFQCLCQFETPS